jgi:hypothetical protein
MVALVGSVQMTNKPCPAWEGVVKMENFAKQLNRLYKQASVEKDPQKFQRLIEKIFQFIEADQKRQSGNAPLNHADSRSEQSRLVVWAAPIGQIGRGNQDTF